MTDALSQDEVDSLFNDAPGAGTSPPEGLDTEGVRPYDLANQERIVRGRMPTLEIINERFARNCRLGLFNFIRRAPEITVGGVKALKYSAFLREMVLPGNLNIINLTSLRGSGLFVFEPALVFGIVEMMFGGDGKIHSRIEGREFTATEQRIIQKLLDIALAEYASAWAPVFKLALEYVRSEMHPQFVNVATPSEVVVTSRFDIEIGHAQGALHICIPYASLEPIRDTLFSSTQSSSGQPDGRWVGMMSSQVQTAEVDLVATLATRRATLRQIMGMRQGDVVPIEIGEHISAHVDGVPLFECRPGTSSGRYAIHIAPITGRPDDLRR